MITYISHNHIFTITYSPHSYINIIIFQIKCLFTTNSFVFKIRKITLAFLIFFCRKMSKLCMKSARIHCYILLFLVTILLLQRQNCFSHYDKKNDSFAGLLQYISSLILLLCQNKPSLSLFLVCFPQYVFVQCYT